MHFRIRVRSAYPYAAGVYQYAGVPPIRGAGVGKGRQLAAIVLDNLARGREKHM